MMNEIDMHNTKVHYEKTVSDGDISCVAEFWMATLRRYNEMMRGDSVDITAAKALGCRLIIADAMMGRRSD